MIVQSSNKPIVIGLKKSIAGYKEIHIALHDKKGNIVKHWTADDVDVVNDNVIVCPVSQAESADFAPGKLYCSIKWLDENDVVRQTNEMPVTIRPYADKHIMGDDEPVTQYDIVFDGDISDAHGKLDPDSIRSAIVIKSGKVDPKEIEAAVKAYLDEQHMPSGTDFAALTARVAANEGNISGIRTDVAGKQSRLTPGDNITIEGNTISANVPEPYDDTALRQELGNIANDVTGKQNKLTPGNNITISGDVISASVPAPYDDSALRAAVAGKQNKLTAGQNITISGDVISASGGGESYDDTEIREELGTLKEDIESHEERIEALEDAPSGGVSDVQINGASIVTDGVANVPIADAYNKYGLAKFSETYGFVISEKMPKIKMASTNSIDDRQSTSVSMETNPIVPRNLDYAVKATMCDGKGAAWTTAEQQAAQARIGILSIEGVTF